MTKHSSRAASRRVLGYAAIFLGFCLLFWFAREQSRSGDWKNWIRYLETGVWFRLREPLCLLLYQIPYRLLSGWGVTAKAVLAVSSCVFGALSMVYLWATLGLLTPSQARRVMGFAAFAGAYGVTGNFFGHVEHYAMMSLGCFAYIYYSVRYLRNERSILAPALALAMLFGTHLMAAWLVPSLAALPWLRPRSPEEARTTPVVAAVRRAAVLRDLGRATLVMAITNLVVWTVIVAFYYDGGITHVFDDATTSSYSKANYGVSNYLRSKGLVEFREILAPSHLRSIFTLFVLYSPFAILVGLFLVASSPARCRRAWTGTPVGRFFLSLAVPYTIYAFVWKAGLGYAADWDLFSHVVIFYLFAVLVAAFAAPSWGRLFQVVMSVGLAASFLLTGYVVVESHRADTPTGVYRVLEAAGEKYLERERRFRGRYWRDRDVTPRKPAQLTPPPGGRTQQPESDDSR